MLPTHFDQNSRNGSNEKFTNNNQLSSIMVNDFQYIDKVSSKCKMYKNVIVYVFQREYAFDIIFDIISKASEKICLLILHKCFRWRDRNEKLDLGFKTHICTLRISTTNWCSLIWVGVGIKIISSLQFWMHYTLTE